jgi:hypothetical protein
MVAHTGFRKAGAEGAARHPGKEFQVEFPMILRGVEAKFHGLPDISPSQRLVDYSHDWYDRYT